MKLNELKPAEGAVKSRKRVGRGKGSGMGKTSTRGEKGQKSRRGYSRQRGFEGGQMPLYRKLPHRGFNNKNFKDVFAVVNVGDLARLDASVSEVNAEVLVQAGITRDASLPVKVLGEGELARAMKVTAAKFSGSAKEKIEKAGGQALVA